MPFSSHFNHENKPYHDYASFNSLNQLYYNYKKSNKKPQSNQEWMDLIQESAQQGVSLNLEQIFKSGFRKSQSLAQDIIQYKENNQYNKSQLLQKIQQKKIKQPNISDYIQP